MVRLTIVSYTVLCLLLVAVTFSYGQTPPDQGSLLQQELDNYVQQQVNWINHIQRQRAEFIQQLQKKQQELQQCKEQLTAVDKEKNDEQKAKKN